MTTSLMQEVETQTSRMKSVLSKLLGRNVTAIHRIGGGRNSRVYRLICRNSSSYVAKLYFRHSLGERDRLETEFSSLQFLWQNGVKCIPQPIAADRDYGCAIYEYINGKEISSQEITNSDIDYAVQFLARLKRLKNKKDSRHLPLASEACFSVQAIVNTIAERLRVLPNDEPQYHALGEFLTNDFIPSFGKITRWCESSLTKSGISSVLDLGCEEKTLSPSDFGFHNALRRCNDQIVFLDFEYFGWDDPAKMVSDFLLHPAMKLSEKLKRRFVKKIFGRFESHGYLERRIEVVYPLFGLNWCLILLNEFVPEHLLRRCFASENSINKRNLQAEQLEKARRMLQTIRRNYEHFPYRG